MPAISRLYIKLGLLYLVLAGAFGVLNPSAPDWFNPTWLHIFVVGWLTQLIFGVASWMFPRISKSNPRGDERLGYAGLVLLNLGLGLRIFFEPARSTEVRGVMLSFSALSQWLAGMLLVAWTWPRVRGR